MHFVCYSSFLDPLEHFAVMYKCEDDTIFRHNRLKDILAKSCHCVHGISTVNASRHSTYGLKLEKASRFDISVASLLSTNIFLPQEQQHVQLS